MFTVPLALSTAAEKTRIRLTSRKTKREHTLIENKAFLEKLKERDRQKEAIQLLSHSWRKAHIQEIEQAPLVLGGKTDFWTKRGWWPFVEVEANFLRWDDGSQKFIQKTKTQMPMKYLGSIIMNNRKAEVFYGVAIEDSLQILWKLRGSLLCKKVVNQREWLQLDEHGEVLEGCFAVIFEDSNGPSWILRKSLMKNFSLARMFPATLDSSNPDWSQEQLCWDVIPHIPTKLLPDEPIWLTEDVAPPAPFTKFVAQFQHGAGDGVFCKHDEEGSLYLFWDGENDFRLVSQTY